MTTEIFVVIRTNISRIFQSKHCTKVITHHISIMTNLINIPLVVYI